MSEHVMATANVRSNAHHSEKLCSHCDLRGTKGGFNAWNTRRRRRCRGGGWPATTPGAVQALAGGWQQWRAIPPQQRLALATLQPLQQEPVCTKCTTPPET